MSRKKILMTCALFCCLLMAGRAQSQIQIGTVKGSVADPAGAFVIEATVEMENAITGYRRTALTGQRGEFIFNNVPFGSYTLRVRAQGFQPASYSIRVRSNVPTSVEAALSVALTSELVSVEAQESLVAADSSSTETQLSESLIRRAAGANRGARLQQLISTAQGWALEDNGLLHIRGVDDGIVYVIDGIPTINRLDALSASAFDTEAIQSLNIITGNIPAEFGGRSGAVVIVQPRSGIDTALAGSVSLAAGSFRTGDLAYTLGGRVKKNFGLFIANSANRSDRFLDPPDPDNFNNRGGSVKLNVRADYHPTAADTLIFNVSANGTDFRVPNRLEQHLAGQRQRQQLRDNSQSASWQRIWSATTVSNLAYFRRSYRAELFASQFDTPLSAQQDREHTHQGIVANVTRIKSGHTFKLGMESSRIAPREFLTFAVTDAEVAEEADISEAAMMFDRAHPFVFRDRKVGSQISWYVQDSFSPAKNLSVSAGLRYDRSTLPVTDRQFSPRLGAVYYITRTKSAVRGSFNRLYMPPQVENLLLADSEQARQLSPFATDESGGGAAIRPEKVSAYEAGFSQDVLGLLRLDAVYWHRSFRNFDDPNVFFSTTIIFPNSVAKGFARGFDLRVDIAQRRGWSGYLSYGNSRVLQTGPINGGLFLTDEFIEIGPGTRFIPDHDQRNTGSFAVIYNSRVRGLWAMFSGKHESGVPTEIEEDDLEELRSAPGADLLDFDRRRVKPWSVFDLSTGFDLLKTESVAASAQLDAQNIFNKRFAYNFGNPFSGTHFGHPRILSARIKLEF